MAKRIWWAHLITVMRYRNPRIWKNVPDKIAAGQRAYVKSEGRVPFGSVLAEILSQCISAVRH
jgi:hypothetical protein